MQEGEGVGKGELGKRVRKKGERRNEREILGREGKNKRHTEGKRIKGIERERERERER